MLQEREFPSNILSLFCPSFIKRFTTLYFYCQFGLLPDFSFRVLCEERVSMQLNSVPWYGRTDHACLVCKKNRCSTDLSVCPPILLQFSIAETLNITNTKVERLVNREGERRKRNFFLFEIVEARGFKTWDSFSDFCGKACGFWLVLWGGFLFRLQWSVLTFIEPIVALGGLALWYGRTRLPMNKIHIRFTDNIRNKNLLFCHSAFVLYHAALIDIRSVWKGDEW